LCTSVGRVGRVDSQSIAFQEIRHSLHGLPGDATPTCDLGDCRGLIIDGVQDDPAGERLIGQFGERLASSCEEGAQPGDLEDQLGEGIPGGRARRPYSRIDIMLSIRYPS
jgi:hypothetical protein